MTRPALKQPLPRDQGFTLMELLVTVVVVIILATSALPLYRTLVTSQRIKTASFDMMALITFSRSEALKRNISVTLDNPTGANFTVTDTSGNVIRQQPMFKGIALDCVNMTVNPHAYIIPCPAGGITYNFNGRASFAGGAQSYAIELHDSDAGGNPAYYRCVTIDLSGRPSSKKGPC